MIVFQIGAKCTAPSLDLARRKKELREAKDDNVVLTFEGHKIMGRHIKALRTGNWLHDEIINVYMLLLRDQCEGYERECPDQMSHFFRVEFLKCLFYPRYNFSVWAEKGKIDLHTCGKDLMQYAHVFFPIATSVNNDSLTSKTNHWILVVARPCKHEIQAYDSCGRKRMAHLNRVKTFMDSLYEYQNKRKDPNNWKLIEGMKGTPQQVNGSDCGVYVLMTIDQLLHEKDPLEITESSASKYRRTIFDSIAKICQL